LSARQIDQRSEHPKGWSELGHYTLVCEACDAKLVDVMVVKKSERVKRFRSDCPCGDRSQVVEVKGETVVGVPGDVPAYEIVDVETSGNLQMFKLQKVKR